jgi:hypothetical protein
MQDHSLTAAQLLEDLAASSYMVGAGQTRAGDPLYAVRRSDRLTIGYNLGGDVATRAQVITLLHQMRDHAAALAGASAAFAAYIAARPLVFEVCVFSGHMDFTVASWDGRGEIEWSVTLE